ncbi:MAG: hypothetical protein Q8T09_00760 [Candidatus Melainabacteria bacterium]|nr:hypothetical protein [Candidatus Melainabacteria bacterium]
MAISVKTRVMIWGRAAHRCSWCRKELEVDDGVVKQPSLVGEIAHMVAEKDDGPRGNPSMPVEERNAYENLLLLCLDHHKFVDDNPTEYPVERLIAMKQRHKEWVQKSLAGFKPADQRNAETYAAYIEEWSSRVHLQDWTDWTASIMRGGTPQISREFYEELSALDEWLFKRIWPPTFPSLAVSLKDFRLVLSDFQKTLGNHLDFDGKDNRLITRKFYKTTGEWLDTDEYRRLSDEYDFHVDLVFDLLLELTRTANRVCDEVRAHIDAAFRVEEGVLAAATSDVFGSTKIRAEYENNSVRYPGLKAFKFERKNRDYNFGRGSTAKDSDKTEDQFNDEALTQAAEQLEGKLAGFKTAESKASEDIRRLESLFAKAGISVEHWITGPNDDPMDSNEIRSIGWAEINGRWRIVHHSSHYEHGGISQAPLIEMAARTKLACVPYLIELLKEIADIIPDAHLELVNE